jgi:flagellum-specific ATP synthase
MLDRRLASENHYPPIAVLDSLSRLMPAVTTRDHLARSGQLRSLLAAYARSEDLIRIGAYSPGSDALLDRAIAILPELQKFLCQTPEEQAPLAETVARLNSLAG